MRRALSLCLTGVAALALFAIPTFDVLAEEYLVLFDNGAQLENGIRPKAELSAKTMTNIVEKAGGEIVRAHPEIGMALVRSEKPNFDKVLSLHRKVNGVTLDGKIRPKRSAAPMTREEAELRTHTDPELREMIKNGIPRTKMVTDPTQAFFYELFGWSLRAMDAPGAWAEGFVGDESVVVAVLDSGIDYTHIDLEGRVDLERSVSFVPEDDALIAELFPDAHPIADLNFHGTFAAGVIACNAIGSSCVAPNVSLVGVKVADKDWLSTYSRMIAGILYATAIDVDVINISFNFFPNVKLDNFNDIIGFIGLKLSIAYAEQQGIFVSIKAGNDPNPPFGPGIDADADGNEVILPAEAGGIIASGTSFEDTFGNFNNFGVSLVDISAPGGQFPFVDLDPLITAVWAPCSSFTQLDIIDFCAIDPPFWVSIGGGNPAAAEVSALAAMIDSTQQGAMTGDELWDQIRETADDLGEPGFDAFFGHGRINIFRAMTEDIGN